MTKLLEFLSQTMSMTEICQPVIARELLLRGGRVTKAELARVLARHDPSLQAEYEYILMRWPRRTLMKHGIVKYDKQSGVFKLTPKLFKPSERRAAVRLCEEAIANSIAGRLRLRTGVRTNASLRYRVLVESGRRCALCGVPASIRPIDVDHIVPRSKADRHNRGTKDGIRMSVDDTRNLQALCIACNRGKRDADQSDFRRTKKLVRDNILSRIRAEGRRPKFKVLRGNQLLRALREKLIEEHSEYMRDYSVEELVDIAEVVFSITEQHGMTRQTFLRKVAEKRVKVGGFAKGYFYAGDET